MSDATQSADAEKGAADTVAQKVHDYTVDEAADYDSEQKLDAQALDTEQTSLADGYLAALQQAFGLANAWPWAQQIVAQAQAEADRVDGPDGTAAAEENQTDADADAQQTQEDSTADAQLTRELDSDQHLHDLEVTQAQTAHDAQYALAAADTTLANDDAYPVDAPAALTAPSYGGSITVSGNYGYSYDIGGYTMGGTTGGYSFGFGMGPWDVTPWYGGWDGGAGLGWQPPPDGSGLVGLASESAQDATQGGSNNGGEAPQGQPAPPDDATTPPPEGPQLPLSSNLIQRPEAQYMPLRGVDEVFIENGAAYWQRRRAFTPEEHASLQGFFANFLIVNYGEPIYIGQAVGDDHVRLAEVVASSEEALPRTVPLDALQKAAATAEAVPAAYPNFAVEAHREVEALIFVVRSGGFSSEGDAGAAKNFGMGALDTAVSGLAASVDPFAQAIQGHSSFYAMPMDGTTSSSSMAPLSGAGITNEFGLAEGVNYNSGAYKWGSRTAVVVIVVGPSLLARGAAPTPLAQTSGSLAPGAALRARVGTQFDEYMHFRNQGFTPVQAKYLTQPYGSRAGHHFPIPQRVGRGVLPDAIVDSRFNVLRPRSISLGRFYELHYRVDPFFNYARFPRSIGGGWNGNTIGLQRYAGLQRIWYATPGPTKVASGTGIIVVGTGGYWWFISGDDGE